MAVLPRALTDPDIGRHLLREEGEVIVDEVRKHWVAYAVPALLCVLGLGCWWLSLTLWSQASWVLFLLGVALICWGVARGLRARMDVFVITNMRVFRVKGVFVRSQATMPLSRILDITVVKPFRGRLLGYGHFTFESAAKDQGLRDITYVGRPDERDLAIQRVVQRAGLRGPKVVN